MARKFGPFDTSVFYEVENRRLQRAFNQQTGFVKSGQGAVTAGTGAELVIAAYPDGALIDGMYVENPTSETVTLTNTNTASTNPRIDRLVMRLDMNAKTIAPFQIVGTPAASPAAPPLVKTATVYDMPLVQYRFPGSASAQNPGSIVDERVYSSDSGWVDLTLKNGWEPGYPTAVRRLNGIVYFRGEIFGGGSGSVAFTVPSGFRPLSRIYTTLVGGVYDTSGALLDHVSGDFTVQTARATSPGYTLGSISYPAA